MRIFALAQKLVAAAVLAAPATTVNSPFECVAPVGWNVQRHPDGVIYVGPREHSGLSPRIIVRWVRNDDRLYRSPGEYERRLAQKPLVAIPGWSAPQAADATIAGRSARRLTRDVTDFTTSGSVGPREVLTREEHLAVSAGKGFYLLVFTAPRDAFARNRRVFDRLVLSFRPRF